MDREKILFRGKCIDEDEWVEGCLIYQGDHWLILQDESRLHPMDVPYIDDFGYINGRADPVVLETVGQYTGLTDKNGKKIFEGDILEFSDRMVSVFWHAHLGCWDSNFLKFTSKENGREDMSPCHWSYRAKVVGNIYDNPELLKGGKK